MSDNFDDIIDFAVVREKQAVKFYQVLQAMSQFDAQKALLKDFEAMERGHVAMLEKIREKGAVSSADIPVVTDLHISEYMVESEPTESMTYQDIIVTAMKREEKATLLYTALAARVTVAEEKNVFLKLAAEEANHKLYFERIYDEEILKEN